VGHEAVQLGVDSTEVPDDSEYQVLATSALSAGQRARKRIEQGINSLAAIEPSGDELRGSRPGVMGG
jgi:hypothetical protein